MRRAIRYAGVRLRHSNPMRTFAADGISRYHKIARLDDKAQ